MNFNEYLALFAQETNKEIDQFLGSWYQEAKKVDKNLSPLVKAFIVSCDGGKRLRGALVGLGYILSGAKSQDKIIKAATAFEIFQTAILSHDDVIDLSPTRRGKPTLYKMLGGGHYGISQTICLGDIGFFLAIKLILDSDFPETRKNLAVSSFVKTMLDTGAGQMLDIALPKFKNGHSERSAITIFKLKTARYTITGPMLLGAILGGANHRLLGKIEEFGEKLGIAFQIQDDILGVFGDEKSLGKSAASDIKEGKLTLLYLRAKKMANVKQQRLLNKWYGNSQVSQLGLNAVRKVFIETGALDYSRQKALKYVMSAKKVVPEMASQPGTAGLLNQLADFLVERDK